ncbi:uncharacterized protein E0L32_007389 [Thyridium curvatum]|uniref:Uncharacterized protein n=1 Tax=Thyridium curvatum TaxID=1093900 RepID=A0A507B498_9PEZI|nr:uncharacterized protein E0L32_007389 [Thyridium curvatum]TPX11891.1 hypothetical protein E0L32_007389 [Thyridium curvatum]
MVPLAGSHALITGGSRGIGLAIAHRLAREGAACTLVGRDEQRLQAALAGAPSPAHAHSYLVGDVRHADFWAEAVAQRPNISILVNAAGLAQNSLLVRTRDEDLQEILDVNLRGTILGCRSFGKSMMKRKAGMLLLAVRAHSRSIINISSLLAEKGGQGATVYAASKAGIIGLTRALATEMGPFGVRVNTILPGYIKTDMTENLKQSLLQEKIPLGRLGEPEEVADAAAFLAKNSYASNCILNLDGGLSAT